MSEVRISELIALEVIILKVMMSAVIVRGGIAKEVTLQNVRPAPFHGRFAGLQNPAACRRSRFGTLKEE
jgi:hypothetical protein